MNAEKVKTSLLVIGGGPGGYNAAFRAADLGLEVTLVDKEKTPGGTCLLQGCIPTKALLHAAKIIADAKEAKDIGIECTHITVDTTKINAWKDSVVTKLKTGLEFLTKKKKVRFIQGHARLISPQAAIIQTENGQEEISFEKAILATGSQPTTLPFVPSSKNFLNSTSALDISTIPKRLLIVGGGYIGLEFACIYSELGSQVTVVEMLPELLGGIDKDFISILKRRLNKRLEAIKLNTKVVKFDENRNSITAHFQDKDGLDSQAEFGKVLIAIGRKPNLADLGIENTKIKTTPEGFVTVAPNRQTAEPTIFAIGDITGQPMLAHKAYHEGFVAAEAANGKDTVFEPKVIPSVVYTDPEIVWCGLTEKEAQEQNVKVDIAKFPWLASGRAATLNRTDGLTKLIIDKKTQKILGVGIVGVDAGELVAECVLAIEKGLTAQELGKIIHPHPTLSETIMEAALNLS